MNICRLEGLMEINSKDLVVEPYHGNPNPRTIQYLVDHFDPLLSTTIKVVYRDGKYFIIDGVQTREALVRIKGTDNFPILCRVFTGLSAEDEARLYTMLHGYNEPSLSFADKLRAMYQTKDADAVRFVEATKDNGFMVSMDNHHAKKGSISAVHTAFRIFLDLGEERYTRMLRLIRAVWKGEAWSLSRNILRGTARFMRMYDFRDEEFIEAFKDVRKADIDAGAASFPSYSREGAFAKSLAQLFDMYLDSQQGTLA